MEEQEKPWVASHNIRLEPCLIVLSHMASKAQQVEPNIIDCAGCIRTFGKQLKKSLVASVRTTANHTMVQVVYNTAYAQPISASQLRTT